MSYFYVGVDIGEVKRPGVKVGPTVNGAAARRRRLEHVTFGLSTEKATSLRVNKLFIIILINH